MAEPVQPRAQVGPYMRDWIGPLVSDVIVLVRGLPSECSPGTQVAIQEDAALVERLLAETSRPHAQGRVLGGRTGRALIAALVRLLTAIRDDLAPDLSAELLAGLDERCAGLAHAARTLVLEATLPARAESGAGVMRGPWEGRGSMPRASRGPAVAASLGRVEDDMATARKCLQAGRRAIARGYAAIAERRARGDDEPTLAALAARLAEAEAKLRAATVQYRNAERTADRAWGVAVAWHRTEGAATEPGPAMSGDGSPRPEL